MAKTFVLRPLRIDRPPEPEPGGRTHRARRRAALNFALATLIATTLFAACGGDSNVTINQDGATQSPGVTVATTAAELIPDLSSLGFKPVPASETGGFIETPASKVALFENPGGKVGSVRLEVALAANTNVATTQFNALAEALKNPPPGLFGGEAKQIDGTGVYQADQSRSFKTDKPDKEGTLVFSDIHRFGRAVVIMYTIGPAGAETEAVRKQVAEQLNARSPR